MPNLAFLGILRLWTLSSGDSWPAIWQLVGVVKPAMQGDQPNPVCKVWPATLATDCTWTTLTIGAATLGTMPSPRTYRTQRGARRAFRSFQDDCAGPVLATSPLALPVPRGGRLPGGLWYPRPYYAQPPRNTFYLPSGRLYNRPNNHPFPLLFLPGGCTYACFKEKNI